MDKKNIVLGFMFLFAVSCSQVFADGSSQEEACVVPEESNFAFDKKVELVRAEMERVELSGPEGRMAVGVLFDCFWTLKYTDELLVIDERSMDLMLKYFPWCFCDGQPYPEAISIVQYLKELAKKQEPRILKYKNF